MTNYSDKSTCLHTFFNLMHKFEKELFYLHPMLEKYVLYKSDVEIMKFILEVISHENGWEWRIFNMMKHFFSDLRHGKISRISMEHNRIQPDDIQIIERMFCDIENKIKKDKIDSDDRKDAEEFSHARYESMKAHVAELCSQIETLNKRVIELENYPKWSTFKNDAYDTLNFVCLYILTLNQICVNMFFNYTSCIGGTVLNPFLNIINYQAHRNTKIVFGLILYMWIAVLIMRFKTMFDAYIINIVNKSDTCPI